VNGWDRKDRSGRKRGKKRSGGESSTRVIFKAVLVIFQSEEEERLNLPHTIFMDRKHPEKLPAVQLSFIQHLVSPLFQACAEAGIIPGISEPVQSTPGPEEVSGDENAAQQGTELSPNHNLV
jgi:hypothetical protein